MLLPLQEIISTMNSTIINNEKASPSLIQEVIPQKRALEKMMLKDSFEKNFQKSKESYEGVRRFLISRKADYELKYDFRNAKLLFSIIGIMPNPNRIQFRD